MQSPNSPDYYLKHSFEKAYSDYGVPYIDEACATGISNNLVIYGHHMKNGTIFSDLCNYTDADFCKEHPIINFDTLSGFGEYQVVAVFKFDTNHEDFRYNEYTQMNEEQFKEFMSQVYARQCYDTGIDPCLVLRQLRREVSLTLKRFMAISVAIGYFRMVRKRSPPCFPL